MITAFFHPREEPHTLCTSDEYLPAKRHNHSRAICRLKGASSNSYTFPGAHQIGSCLFLTFSTQTVKRSVGHPIDNHLNNVFCIAQSTALKKIPDRYFYIILHNAFKFPLSFLLLCRYSLHPLKKLYVSDLFLNNVSFLFFNRY